MRRPSFLCSDGLPYEKRVDAKGRVSAPVCIADEVPFEVPEGWEWARLGALVDMQAGRNIAASKIAGVKDADHPYPCFGGNGVRGFVSRPNRRGWFPIIGRQGARCGCINYAKGDFYATEHAVVVTCSGDVSVEWCGMMLEALNLNQYATATAQPGLAVSKIAQLLVPLPPLAEQRRIVAKVEELMPLVEGYGALEDERERLDAALPDALRKSVLQEAVEGRLVPQDPADEPASELLARTRDERRRLVAQGKLKFPRGGESVIYRASDGRRYEKRVDAKGRESEPVCIEDEIPFEVPEGWEWARLESVITLISGTDLATSKFNDRHKGIPYLTGASNFDDGRLIENRWTTAPTRISHEGDLLITCKGTVGQMAINTFSDAHIARQIMAIVPTYWDMLPYIRLFLTSMVNQIQGAAKGVIPGIERDTILLALLPVPPLAEQRRIVAKVEELLDIFTNR